MFRSGINSLSTAVDSILAISYQVAMVFSVLSIYELNPNDYDIIKIILSGGKTIEEKKISHNLLQSFFLLGLFPKRAVRHNNIRDFSTIQLSPNI